MSRLFLLALIGALSGAGCTDGGRYQAIADVVKRIEKNKLKTHVEAVTHYGPRSVDDRQATDHTVRYIKSLLTEYGYQPIEEPLGNYKTPEGNNYSFINIIAEHAGKGESSRILELGTHYDTVDDSPGADDNASGVAAILEIARVLSSVETKRTVRFCFFALEEHGRDGSDFHVEQIRNRNEELDGAIILEMIGYATDQPDTQATPVRIPLLFSPPTTGNFITVVGNFRSGGIGNRFERAAKRYVPALPYFSANLVGGFFKDALRSDHKPYWDNGYRAIMLTDTANFRNPHYHKASDLPDSLNFDFLHRVTQAITATFLDWGG
jgi:aminopeptidase YwaD